MGWHLSQRQKTDISALSGRHPSLKILDTPLNSVQCMVFSASLVADS